MREVLDYKESDLQNLSLSELKQLLRIAKSEEGKYDVEQNMYKVLANGLYGAMANKWFPLFNEKLAAAITGNGRYFIRSTGALVEKFLQSKLPSTRPYLVYIDTDSCYFNIQEYVELYIKNKPDATMNEITDFCDKFSNEVIQPIIQQSINSLADNFNAFDVDVIRMSREIIADKSIFLSKKKYMARVRDDEGHRLAEENPDFKVMGLDIIKGGTPNWSRSRLKLAVPHILDKCEIELRAWLQEAKKEYTNTHPNDIVGISGVSNLEYTLGEKGVPIGARSALVYNKYIQDNKLDDIYPAIDAGERTKRCYLREPNKFNSNVVAYMVDSFYKEFEDCIDWDVMFEKNFTNLLENMIKGLGYNILQETASLDDW